MSNPIMDTSLFYKELCAAYEETDKKMRFERCYKLADEATYEDIHYAITMLKEAGFDDDLPELSVGGFSITNLLNAAKAFFAADVVRRKAFLMDILEEARERKRPC